jgi:hypothetical protein
MHDMTDATRNESHKRLVRMIVEEMFNRGNLAVAREIFSTDFVDRGHAQVAKKRTGRRGLPSS